MNPAVGGPIQKDTAHFFVAYEGKNIATPRNVGLASVSTLLPNAGLAAMDIADGGAAPGGGVRHHHHARPGA